MEHEIRNHEDDLVEALLNAKRKIEVSPHDLDGKTPVQLTCQYEIILIGHAANPQDQYGRELQRSKNIHQLHPFTKLFVLGDS